MTIGILGGGVWGSALARVLSNNKVIIYARDEKIVKSINEHKINPKLKYSSFNENVTASTSLKEIRNVKFFFKLINKFFMRLYHYLINLF